MKVFGKRVITVLQPNGTRRIASTFNPKNGCWRVQMEDNVRSRKPSK